MEKDAQSGPKFKNPIAKRMDINGYIEADSITQENLEKLRKRAALVEVRTPMLLYKTEDDLV